MKIPFLTEVAAIFDVLSVLEIKQKVLISRNEPHSHLKDEITELQKQLNQHVGYDFSRQIYLSQEYKKLYQANYRIFDLIDESHKEDQNILLNEADYFNHLRYEAKNELQKKFFGEGLKEVKIGY